MHCDINLEAFRALAQAWQDGAPCAQTLQYLCLTSEYDIEDGSLEALANALEVDALPSLKRLVVGTESRADISEGLLALIQALRAEEGVGSHLDSLMLEARGVRRAATEALAEGLMKGMMPCVNHLSLPIRMKERVEEALEASGRRKGGGGKEVGTYFSGAIGDDDGEDYEGEDYEFQEDDDNGEDDYDDDGGDYYYDSDENYAEV